MSKKFKTIIVTLSLAVFLLTSELLSAAVIAIRVAPPRPRKEVVIVRTSPKHVWIAGYWHWTGSEYNWVAGSWQLPPPHRHHWVPGHYKHVRGGWAWIPGHWR